MRRALISTLAAGAILATTAGPAAAQQLVQFPGPGQNFNVPFHVAAPPGDASRVFVVEAPGTIRLVKDGVVQPTAFLDASADVFDIGEGGCECGMFSMAFAPDYATNGRFYVFYTRDVLLSQHELVIREYRRSAGNPDLADPASARDVLVIPHPDASNHNGGQLAFGPDGHLYIATGDGGSTPQLAQSRTTMLGKLLRINPAGNLPGEYSIPAGNPFADGAGGNADEIYAYGLRNPYRFSFDRLTGDLVIGDVGQALREEVDFVPAGTAPGLNFGWRCFEGTLPLVTTAECDPPLANHTPPVLEYSRGASPGAAVNGGFVVRDTTVPSLLGRYVYGDSGDALMDHVFSATLSGTGSAGNASTGMVANALVSFGEDACGHVYVAAGATVSRIQQSAVAPACAPQVPPAGQPGPIATVPTVVDEKKRSKRKCKKGKVRSKKTGKCRKKKRARR
jgi:glucose/arabinose dehydrogenase